MKRITDKVFIDPEEVASLEYEEGGYQTTADFYTKITLKNGRVILVPRLKPNEVRDKLQ